jgi:hypothetical protein
MYADVLERGAGVPWDGRRVASACRLDQNEAAQLSSKRLARVMYCNADWLQEQKDEWEAANRGFADAQSDPERPT